MLCFLCGNNINDRSERRFRDPVYVSEVQVNEHGDKVFAKAHIGCCVKLLDETFLAITRNKTIGELVKGEFVERCK